MATRAMYLSVKMDADTKYFSLVQAVFDYLKTTFSNTQIGFLSTTTNYIHASYELALKTNIDGFFSNKKGAIISTNGETLIDNTLSSATAQTIPSSASASASITTYSVFFASSYTNAISVNNLVGSYVRFKIASMIDEDYTAFVDKLRTNVKAAYPIDRVWNETNTPTA